MQTTIMEAQVVTQQQVHTLTMELRALRGDVAQLREDRIEKGIRTQTISAIILLGGNSPLANLKWFVLHCLLLS